MRGKGARAGVEEVQSPFRTTEVPAALTREVARECAAPPGRRPAPAAPPPASPRPAPVGDHTAGTAQWLAAQRIPRVPTAMQIPRVLTVMLCARVSAAVGPGAQEPLSGDRIRPRMFRKLVGLPNHLLPLRSPAH